MSVLAACTDTVGGTALPRQSKTLPVEQILPSAAEVAAAVGNPMDPSGSPMLGGLDVLPNGIRDDSAASPIGCLGAVMPFMRVVYEQGDIRAAAWQGFSRFGTGATVSSVDAGVVGFGSNAEAQRMFDVFAAQWRGCQGTTVTTHLPIGELHATVTDVRTHVYKAGAIQKFWKFDGKMSTSISWFTNTKLTGSSYMDLPAGPFNFFSILGDGPNNAGRRFFINRNYGGCNVDAGWLVLDTAPDPCAWDTNKNAAAIRILYAAGQTFATWQNAIDNNQLGVGDAYAVFVR